MQRLLRAYTTRPPAVTHLSYDTIGVYQEQAPQRNTLLLEKHAVVLAQLVVLVAEERDVDGAEAAISSAGVRPGEQAVLAVGAGKDHGRIAGLEIGDAVAEGDDLSRADKGPGHGHEAEDEPLLGGCVGGQAQVWGDISLRGTQMVGAWDRQGKTHLRKCHQPRRCLRSAARASARGPWACTLGTTWRLSAFGDS